MKNKLLFIILLSVIKNYSQEYAVWMTSRDYFHIPRADGRTSHAYVLQVFNVEERDQIATLPDGQVINFGPTTVTSDIGIHKQEDTSKPFKLTSKIIGMLALSNFLSEKDLVKYEPHAGGWTFKAGTLGHLLNTVSSKLSDINEFYFYSIVLPYYSQPVDGERAREDALFKTAKNTFSDPVVKIPEIIWKYNYDNQGFKDFPESIKHNFPMKSTITEILANETIHIGKTLRVKAVLDNTNLKTYQGPFVGSEPIEKLPTLETSIFSFNTIASSPEFKDAIPKPLTCNYDTNGSFELIMGRNLYADEKLAITIYEKDTGNVPSGGQNLNVRRADIIDNSNNTYSYKWPNELPAGTFEIKYQTGETSEDLSNTFDSLESTGEFTIIKPAAVTYSLTSVKDRTCFTKNDGYIDIRADGQSGRTFFYQYFKNGELQIIAGNDWIPFTNAKTTRISGLETADYRIKVRDSRGCFYRIIE